MSKVKEKIRKVNIEIETKNLASAPTGVELDSFRGEMEQALRSDLQIQKTALSSLIQRIDVTQDGKVGVEFYINTRAVDNTPYPVLPRSAGLANPGEVGELLILNLTSIRRST